MDLGMPMLTLCSPARVTNVSEYHKGVRARQCQKISYFYEEPHGPFAFTPVMVVGIQHALDACDLTIQLGIGTVYLRELQKKSRLSGML